MENNHYTFIKTHEIDKEKFAELLLRAKGGRTMKYFAELCGVNPSTFTRIIHKMNKGASSTDVIEAIAKNTAPNSGVTLEALALANGYSIKENVDNNAIGQALTPFDFINVARNIMIQELLDRDQGVQIGTIKYLYGKTMVLNRNGLFTEGPGQEKAIWFLDTYFAPWEMKYPALLKRNVFDKLSRFVFIHLNKETLNKPSRFSLVFFSKECFEAAVEEFSETPVPTYISLVLMDTIKNSILDEVVLPHFTTGPQESFFMTTAITNIDNTVDCFDVENYDFEYYKGEDSDKENTY